MPISVIFQLKKRPIFNFLRAGSKKIEKWDLGIGVYQAGLWGKTRDYRVFRRILIENSPVGAKIGGQGNFNRKGGTLDWKFPKPPFSAKNRLSQINNWKTHPTVPRNRLESGSHKRPFFNWKTPFFPIPGSTQTWLVKPTVYRQNPIGNGSKRVHFSIEKPHFFNSWVLHKPG